MAEASVSVDEFSCPVCLDLLKDPVTIPCGHSYCMSCITGCWDQEDPTRVYSCPQCRQTFSPRPALCKNVLFAEMVEKLKTKLQTAVPAAPGDTQCDVCAGGKYKAVKSCLVCLNSYCQTHFERHEEFHPGNRHQVIDATRGLQEMICHKHNKLLELYCRTEQMCVCVLCMVDEHRNHDTVSAALQRTEKQKHLKDMQLTSQLSIQQTEKDLQLLSETVRSHKRSAQTALQDSERIFTELIHSIERSHAEVTQRIRDQERAAVSRAEGLSKQLEQEISDLRRRDAELEQLSHTPDNIHFLQRLQALSGPLQEHVDRTALRLTLNSQLTFDDVKKSASVLRKKLEVFCKSIEMISDGARFKSIPSSDPKPREEILQSRFSRTSPSSDPRTRQAFLSRLNAFFFAPQTRDEFLQCFCQLTLDVNTVNPVLRLSHANRVVLHSDTHNVYPKHADRFDYWEQVLCKESCVVGRSYWEVEWNMNGAVNIAASYKGICRKGRMNNRECLFGCNDHSWSLSCSGSRYSFSHNSVETELPVAPTSRRVGVYVDKSAGILAFYSVSVDDTMRLIHRVQTTFTQLLYPGFRVYYGTLVKLCDLPVQRRLGAAYKVIPQKAVGKG